MDRILLRVGEAAELAGIGRSSGYELVRSGEWPAIRVGTSIRIPADALRRWVDDQLGNRGTQRIGREDRDEGADPWTGS